MAGTAWQGSKDRKPADHNFFHAHEAETGTWRWGEAINPQSPPSVIYFL